MKTTQVLKRVGEYSLVVGALIGLHYYRTADIPQSPIKPAIHSTNTYLISNDVLKLFVKSSSEKVYSRLSNEIVAAANDYAIKYKLSPVLVLSVIKAESEFNINAISKTDAKGLMQIQLNVWGKELKEKGIIKENSDIHDPIKNIECGCYILRVLLDQSKDFETALNKYLGADSVSYKESIRKSVGGILMLGIEKEINAPYKSKQ